MRRNRLHDVTVDILAERLERSGRYDIVQRNRCYSRNGLHGELDVYARSNDDHIYFEVKSSLCPTTLRKAQQQAFRAVIAHPQERWRCVLVLPPEGHPESWLDQPRPPLRVQRLAPACFHFPPAQPVSDGPKRTPLCSLCGSQFVRDAHGFDPQGYAAKERVLQYIRYLHEHPRQAR